MNHEATITTTESTHNYLQKMSIPLARFALFIVFFWFGILKIIGSSPANPLMANLLEKTLPFVTFDQFIICFGLFEILIGLLFLFKRSVWFATILLIPHMITTVLPLILLPAITWQGILTPSLEGQYIIKNILIIALALILISQPKKLELNNGKK